MKTANAPQLDLVAGYSQRLTDRTFVKLGAGLEAAIFDENCRFVAETGKRHCASRREYGPTYKLGYFFRPRKEFLVGLEYNRDELSAIRKYNGLSVVVNTGF